MPLDLTQKPSPSEYAEYYGRYVDKVPSGHILDILESQIEDTARLLGALPEEKSLYRYAPDKWSLRELAGHLADCERIFAYRGLRFARNDTTALPGFEQNDYVPMGEFDKRTMKDLVSELAAVRHSNLLLFRGFPDAAWMRNGTASDCPFSVRAIPFIIAGHERHHVGVIRERYL